MKSEYPIPIGWEIRPLGELCSDKGAYGANERKVAFDPMLPRYVRISDIKEDGSLNNKDLASISEDAAAPYILSDGDLLLARSGATVGKSYLHSTVNGRCAYAGYLIRFRTRTELLSPNYLAQFVRSSHYWAWVRDTQRAQAQPNINASEYASLLVPLPPLPEQRKIAAILSSVDDAIESSQAVIDQLQVVKKAMMAELLTRGIPGRHSRFKSTEIGLVPEDWEVVSLESISLTITKGESPRWQGFEYQSDGALFVTSENVRDGVLDISEPKFISLEFSSKLARSRLLPGDVLVNIVGASIGRAAQWRGEYSEGNVNQAVAVIRPDPNRIIPRLVLDAFCSPRGQDYFGTSKVDNARPNVSLTNLRDFLMVIPSIDEQHQIRAIADALESRLAAERESLNWSRSVKSALMSVLLTGQVRVRPDPCPAPAPEASVQASL